MPKPDKLPTRIFSVLIVLLFLLPILFSAGYIVWQATRNNGQTASTTINATANNNSNANKTGDISMDQSKLAGKPLANFTPSTTPVTQLQITDTTVGTGDTVQPGANVTVDYTGALVSNGVVFESSLDSGQPATFGLNQVIEGWQKGVPGMKVGGTRRLVIPAAEAYGSASPSASIPPNSDLVFDITLRSINK